MATVTGLTAAYMQDIVDDTVIGGHIDISGNLILEQHDGSTIDAGSALPAVPVASTTVQGKVELATDTEAVTGTDTIRAITPANATAILNNLKALDISIPEDKRFVVGGSTSSASVAVKRTSGSSFAFSARNGSDADNRIVVDATGKLSWGDGTASPDTTLYRAAADTLQTDDAIRSVRSAIGVGSFATQVTGDSQNRFLVTADGGMSWGNGSGARDTNLYRSGGDQLKTDDEFVAGGQLYHKGYSVATFDGLGVSGLTRTATSGSTSPSSESALGTSWANGFNSMLFQNGYVYLVIVWYQLSDNINSSYSITIPRLYTTGGTNIGGWVHYNGFNGHLGLTYTQITYVKRIAGSDLNAGVGMTVQRYFSGIAGTSNLDNAVVSIGNLGKVSDHPNYAGLAAAI